MSTFKHALLIEGPGFSDVQEVARSLELIDCRVSRQPVGFLDDVPALKDLSPFDLVLLRGPWSLSPEERLLDRQLARLLSDLTKKTPQMPRILGLGRGALILMELLKIQPQKWVSAFEDLGPWIDVTIADSGLSGLKAHVNARALPQFSDAPDLSVWGTTANTPVGWRKDGRYIWSVVDLLAFSERSQLPDFGYADLTAIPTQAQILKAILEMAP